MCPDLSVFDVGGQIASIFTKSNLNKIAQVDALANWNFWEDPTFYVILGMSIWLIATIVFVLKVIPNKNILAKYQKIPEKTDWLKFRTLLGMMHPLAMIYLHKNPKVTKVEAAILFYFRTILALTFSSIFSTEENRKVGGFMNPYLIFIPYITFVPIYGVFYALIMRPPPQLKIFYKIGEKFVDPSVTRREKIRKVLRILGHVFTYLITLGCIFIIFVISANQQPLERIFWVISFAKCAGQDFFVTPLIQTLLQVGAFLLVRKHFRRRFKRSKKDNMGKVAKVIIFYLNEPVKQVYLNKSSSYQPGEDGNSEMRENNSLSAIVKTSMRFQQIISRRLAETSQPVLVTNMPESEQLNTSISSIIPNSASVQVS